MASPIFPNQNTQSIEPIDISFCQPEKLRNYEWLQFPSHFQEISYIETFLNDKKSETLNYLTLDIEDFNLDKFQEHNNTSMNDIVKDQYLRILKYGNVSSFQPKEKKTPEKDFEKDYDLDDSFIDDSEMDKGLIKMEVYQAQYNDYSVIEGGLTALLQTEHYKNRLNDLENIRNFSQEDKKIYMEKAHRKKHTKKRKKSQHNKEIKKFEIIREEDELKLKQSHLLFFDNLRTEEKAECQEEKKIRSETPSTKKSKAKGKKMKDVSSVKKNASKKKRESMENKDNIFNANHPTLGKFKISKSKN